MASIVVIDDDRDIADLVAVYLRRDGHDLHVAHSGVDGLAAIREIRPALAVVDWMMPELDGIDVAHAVRDEPALDRTALLMVSARSSPDDIEVARSAGFAAVVSKPFRRLELLEVAGELLRHAS
ncbi:response regulator [Microbacterium sp. KSW2-21]|uniref:Response regulator n=1 Tax=Microbacterium algihabitans TaxID=3075992 RepID=A0ABU3S096_9MICO|nr:response regulator [Microbacterium sp. KSW2-21]MDU0328533.1 response regulator [Microbacterium sp. KSW2-21]